MALEHVVSKTVGLTPTTYQVPMKRVVSQVATVFSADTEEDEEFPIVILIMVCSITKF